MIGKAHSGSGFAGLTRYLLHGKKNDPKPDRVEWTSARELALEDPREAALLMRMTAAQGRSKEPVHHLSMIRNPVRTSLWLTTQALALPSLPVRIATMAWDLVRGQVLSR